MLVRLHAGTHVRLYACTLVRLFACMLVRLHSCTLIHMYACTLVRCAMLCACALVRLYTCTSVRFYMLVRLYACAAALVRFYARVLVVLQGWCSARRGLRRDIVLQGGVPQGGALQRGSSAWVGFRGEFHTGGGSAGGSFACSEIKNLMWLNAGGLTVEKFLMAHSM